MILLPYSRPWTQQPQEAVRINWAHPLARGLVSAFVGGVDVCTEAPTGVAAGSTTRSGITWRNGAARYNAAVDVAEITLICHFYFTSNQGNYAGFSAGHYTASNDNQDIAIGLDGASNRMYATNRHDLGGETYFDSFASFPYEAVWTIEGSLGPGVTANLYKNGVFFGTVAPTGTAAFRQRATNVATFATAGTSVSGAWAYRYARRLSASEIADLTANPWQILEPQRIWVPVSAGGGGTSVGLATETDAALALAALHLQAVGRADEADTALALSSGSAAPVGTAVETDSALSLSALQIATAGTALETDIALALIPNAPGSVGVALEADTALALAAVQSRQVGTATESASALALAAVQAITAGMALEIDAGLPLTGSQLRTVGRADEIDAALSLSAGSGGTASAADVWSYVLSNGLTAEQTLVAVHTWLSELHLIHGLTAGSPLSVTAASRAAGAVSQAVAEAAGTVTVTRQ